MGRAAVVLGVEVVDAVVVDVVSTRLLSAGVADVSACVVGVSVLLSLLRTATTDDCVV